MPFSNQQWRRTRWALIGIFFIFNIIADISFDPFVQNLSPLIITLTLFTVVILHGKERYGLKNTICFFMFAWLISHFFEALSIKTGFPFGQYYYDKLIGPRLFNVPLIIMFAYFGTGYAAWAIANIFLGQYNKKLQGKYLFLVPLLGTFIMVMWDLCMDPIASTIDNLWVWRNGGAYFGVPLQNYFGWFLVVYLIFQSFAFFISRYDHEYYRRKQNVNSALFWLEPIALYSIEAVSLILPAFIHSSHANIYGPMALVTIFTMGFVSLIALLKIHDYETN